MIKGIHISGPVAFMEASGAAVYFSKSASSAGSFNLKTKGTSPEIRKIENDLKVAYWGEDNRFPQNIESQMAYCGVGKAALDWKARALYGSGIIPGIIEDYEDGGKTEVFKPLPRAGNKDIYAFLENRAMFRFMLEYLQDWTWFGNCFPEAIFSEDCSRITHFVHQESCDSRFTQQEKDGSIKSVLLSKIWGASKSQFAQFDPTKRAPGLVENPNPVSSTYKEFIAEVDCIDMYDSLESARKIAEVLKDKSGLKSAILPTNYPSVNKTYYQVPAWDGARLGGWVEIACKIPQIIKLFLQKGQRIQYHIEIPEDYFEKKYTKEVWGGMDKAKRDKAREDLLQSMDDFLTSDKAAFSTFVSFFDVDPREKKESGRLKITALDAKFSIDSNLLTTSAADLQILAAMSVHPTLFGSGTIGNGTQRTGGSDQREAFLIYNAQLKLERQVLLEPLYLARDFNGWDPAIQFRMVDTQLTTLDQNKGTTKVVS